MHDRYGLVQNARVSKKARYYDESTLTDRQIPMPHGTICACLPERGSVQSFDFLMVKFGLLR
jgi:hypothetical protein